jgi:HEPN domain-containing protein
MAAEAEAWMERAQDGLREADALLESGSAYDAVARAYHAMICAVRAVLAASNTPEGPDLVGSFKERANDLGISSGSRRALIIIRNLYEDTAAQEMDPETAAACLADSRDFIGELAKYPAS